MANFVGLAALAERLINENGRDVTLKRDDRSPADAAKPWRGPASPGTPTTKTVKAVFVDPMGGGWGREDADELAGLLKRGEQMLLVSGNSVSPELIETFDSVLDGSDVWKVNKVNKLKPATLTIVYGLEVSR